MSKHHIVALQERLEHDTMRITLTYVSPEIVQFMQRSKQFTLKDGTEFLSNDNQLVIKTKNGKVVGQIQGLSGSNPRKSVMIRTQVEGLLKRIAAEFFAALNELCHVVKHFRHGPVACNTNVYTPMIVGSPVNDNSTQNFISNLNSNRLLSSGAALKVDYLMM